jgi:hypothetical protein
MSVKSGASSQVLAWAPLIMAASFLWPDRCKKRSRRWMASYNDC